MPEQPAAPVAKKVPVTTTHHGDTFVDDYEWLRAKDDPEVVAHLEAENAWTQQRTAHLADLRERIFDEIKARTRETDLSVPYRIRGHWYYSRSFEGREYGASCRVPVAGPDDWTPPRPAEDSAPDQPALPGEQVLLDLNALADGHDFFSLGGSSIAPDERLLAYATDVVGDERYTIRVLDVGTGEHLADEITGVLGGATWDADGSAFYYSTVDESWRPDKIWRHVLGTSQADDEVVYTEPDARFWLGIGRTRSDRFLMVASGSKTTSAYRVLDTQDRDKGWQEWPRVEGVEYSLEHAVIGGEDVFLVLHNATGPDFELATAPITPTSVDAWKPLIPHTAGVRLEDVDAFAGHLVVHQRSGGLTRLRILPLDPAGIADDFLVEFDDEVYTIGSGSNPEFTQPVVRLGYTTMARPGAVYSYDVASRELTVLKESEVLPAPDGRPFDPAAYEEHRIWATADDGTQVPISLVVPAGAPRDGSVPVLLYGYGSYESSIDPYFSVARLSLLDRGVGFAIAHVRGGGEMGRHWYEDGKLLKKRNTFTDFIACARHLVAEGWASADHLVAEGGSAGGLLMGAVTNLAPELWAGVVAQVPFVDALTTMLDASLPLTVMEYEEWGNPTDDPATYEYMRGYAPYHNVAAVDYPPILAETSLNDTRVLYVEPAKWIAKLRDTAVGRRDFLLKTEMAAGHGGVSGRYQAWRDRAFTLAWILDRMGRA
ncbi:S9 family peptidase [Nocardioides jiangxiensis]|uniref:S9 family peptidase n=1 Tax=Nocardioides jiangxiensis TaxID=3064524 RepID=A0ABT9B8E8_9ACTN|nr:S9 family peptidase [Nocardioides sp. WY-20]MDO7869418.1 S9 family peptidase [Nocardioides sp. WY-20]